MAEIKGVSPEAETVTNQNGGMQSKTEYAFHLCDPDAMLALAETLQIGANKYARDNWKKIPSEEHFNHLVIHYYAWLKGDKSDNHLAHMFCRAMMLYAVGKAEEQGNNAIASNNTLKSITINNTLDTCLSCGRYIPEGRQICPICHKVETII